MMCHFLRQFNQYSIVYGALSALEIEGYVGQVKQELWRKAHIYFQKLPDTQHVDCLFLLLSVV